MTEKSKHQRAKAEVFNLSWETDDEPEDDRRETHDEGSDEDWQQQPASRLGGRQLLLSASGHSGRLRGRGRQRC